MIPFAIRDDDTSGWTEPDELASCYGEVWKRGMPVSLAVIPEAARSFHPEDRDRFYQTEETRPLHENRRLVDALRKRIGTGEVEIMLHGFDHRYVVAGSQRSDFRPATKPWVDGLRAATPGAALVWRGEYAWKDAAQLAGETASGKTHLESTLGCAVRVFVPPSNQIGRAGTRAVEAAGLDLSALMGRGIDRPLSWPFARAWVSRWTFRVSRGRPYPWVLDLGAHKELVAYPLTPSASFEGLRESLRYCFARRAPFVLATHHWEIARHPMLHEQLLALCDEAVALGFRPATVGDCFAR